MEFILIKNSSNSTEVLSNLSTMQLNTTFHIYDEIIEAPSYIVFTATILYCMIFLVGVVGNILVITVIISSKKMKTTVNKYLLNLCFADVMVILICMPTALADIFTKEVWYFGEYMCKTVPFLENTIANASVLTILAISLQRYRVVCYPLKGVGKNSVKVWKKIVLVWAISIVSSVPWLFIAVLRPSTFHDGTPIQVCRNPIVKGWHKIYVVGLAVLFFLLPCIIMLFINCHLCCVLRTTRQFDAFLHENNRERKHKKHQILNTIASLILVFFICHLPFRVAVLWFSFADKNVIWNLGLEKFLLILYSTRIMFYTNHALNPVIYNFVSSKFRSALRIFCRTATLRNCFTWKTLYKRRQSIETFQSTRSCTTQRSNRLTLTNKFLLGPLERTGARSIPKRVRVEYPGIGQTSNKVLVTKYLNNEPSSSSSSSDGGIKVRIHIEDQSVDIKFKLQRVPNT